MGHCTLWRFGFGGDGSHRSLSPNLKYASDSTTKWICSQITTFHHAFSHIRDAFLAYLLSSPFGVHESFQRERGMSKDFKELGVGVGKDLDCDLERNESMARTRSKVALIEIGRAHV